jgi:hypothetical protein
LDAWLACYKRKRFGWWCSWATVRVGYHLVGCQGEREKGDGDGLGLVKVSFRFFFSLLSFSDFNLKPKPK